MYICDIILTIIKLTDHENQIFFTPHLQYMYVDW